jgi:TPP-dependent pyruvate/acetoin dehydrogenase alpha subunit
MNINTLSLLSIACLLFITNSSYAVSHDSKNDTSVHVDKLSDDNDYEGNIIQGRSRAVGAALANKYNKDQPINPDKERIKELEDLVSQQQKLIEMYKKKSKP